MKPINFPEKNKVYTKPQGMTDEECSSLDVFQDSENIISCWEFDGNELLHALFFRKVWLRVFMNVQPPVYLSPEFPFTKTADGEEPQPIEKIVEQMIDRKIKQFLIQEVRKTDDLTEIDVLQSDWLKKLMIDYTNFFAGIGEKE